MHFIKCPKYDNKRYEYIGPWLAIWKALFDYKAVNSTLPSGKLAGPPCGGAESNPDISRATSSSNFKAPCPVRLENVEKAKVML